MTQLGLRDQEIRIAKDALAAAEVSHTHMFLCVCVCVLSDVTFSSFRSLLSLLGTCGAPDTDC